MVEEAKTNPQSLEVRARAVVEIGRSDERRQLTAEQRQMDDAAKAAYQACRSLWATCYAAINYAYYAPGDAVTDEVYRAIRDCYDVCDLHLSLLVRESGLTADSAELCTAACRAAAEACNASEDAILGAVRTVALATVEVLQPAVAAGEEQEGRHGQQSPVEIRSFRPEVRFAAGEPMTIRGYPIVFGELSEDLGGFREIIRHGAIQFSDDVRADFNHDSNCILGRVSSGTLKLAVDQRGVSMEANPPDAQWARDLMVSIERGDIDQGSFAFRVLPDGQEWTISNGQKIRTLTKIAVSRVSVVSDPAYTATRIQVRSTKDVLAEFRAAEAGGDKSNPAGQLAPPVARDGGVEVDLLRRSLDLSLLEV